jgi:hypothetical protein
MSRREPTAHTVHIQKYRGEGVGIGIRGGVDEEFPICVSALIPTLPAARSGKIHIGDKILAVEHDYAGSLTYTKVNEEDVSRLTHNETVCPNPSPPLLTVQAQLLSNTRLWVGRSRQADIQDHLTMTILSFGALSPRSNHC